MTSHPVPSPLPFPGPAPGDARSGWTGVWLATIVGLLARLFRYPSQSLWVDEIFSWQNAEIGGHLSAGDVVSNSHGPLLQVILHALGGWLGDSEAVLRAPSVLAGACTAPVFAALAGRVLGPPARVPAAWLAALSPFLVWYGQEARNYPFAILFAALAAWAAVRWKEEGGLAPSLLFILSAWLGLLSNLNVALVLPVLFLYLLWPSRDRGPAPAAVAASFAALVLLESPWIWDHVHRLEVERLVPGRDELPGEVPLRGPTTFTWMAYPFTLYVFSVGYTMGPPMSALHTGPPLQAALSHWPVVVPSAILFACLGLAGVWALRRHPRSLWLSIGILLVPSILVTYFAVQNFKVYNPRYVSSGLVGYYLLVVAGWLSLGRRWRFAAAVVLAFLWSGSLYHLYFDPQYGREDYRAATAWLAGQIEPDDQLIATGNYSPLDYYWGDRKPEYDFFWLGYSYDPSKMKEKFSSVEDPARDRWVIVSRPYLDDPEGRFERYLAGERRGVRTEFPGVRIYRLPAP